MSQSHFVTVVQDLRRIAGANPSDEQLLEAFALLKDEQAFATLVRRHGPLVMGVCRRSLIHEQDAEDAFQATFLALARQSASIRHRGSLAAWLHGVSYRIAMTAKRTLVRQRRQEQAGARTEATSSDDNLSWREVRELLDEEVAKLPESYRAVFVLCCLQEKTKPEAAKLLGLKEGTVSSRLARAKERLHESLTKRGVTLSVLMATLGLAQSSLSAAMLKAAAKVAVAGAAGAGGVVPARVAALADGVTNAMLYTKAKMAAGLMLLLGMILVPLAAQSPKPDAPARDAAARAPAPKEKADALEVRARVVDPDGKPVAGAKLYHVVSTNLEDAPARPPLLLGTSDATGAASASVPRAAEGGPRRFRPLLVAVAPGYGPALAAPSPGDVTLRLAKDDLPIEGRIVTLEGKPIAGVTVKPMLLAANEKGDLRPWLALALAKKPQRMEDHFPHQIVAPAGLPGLPASLKTDADGKFRLTGVGRERVVMLEVSGPRIESNFFLALTRAGKPFRFQDAPGSDAEFQVFPATFDYIAGPPQPIVGTVRDKATGKPIAGASIDTGMGFFWRATTGADGTYRIDSLPSFVRRGPGLMLSAIPPRDRPYLPALKVAPRQPGVEPVRVDFDLTLGVWAEGRVIDKATGKPVTATIDYYPEGRNPRLKGYTDVPSLQRLGSELFKTKSDGSFRVPVLPGRGALAARATNGKPFLPADALTKEERSQLALAAPDFLINYHALAAIDADEEKPCRCDLTVDPGRSLKATIVDPKGKPVTGARARGVHPVDFWPEKPSPGADLTLLALHPTKPRWVVVVHTERQLGALLEVGAGRKEPVEIRLQNTGTVTGRLLDAEGRPWKRQDLRTLYDSKGRPGSVEGHTPEVAATDDDGRFRITGLIPGLTYQVNVAGKPPNLTTGSVKTGLKPRSGEVIDIGDVKARMFRD